MNQGHPWPLAEARSAPCMVAALGDVQRMQRLRISSRKELVAVLEVTAERGHLELLRGLLKHRKRVTVPPTVCQQAADYDQVEMAKHGCPMPPHLVSELVQSWYCFVGLMRWAERQIMPPFDWQGAQDGLRAQQAWQMGLLQQIIRLPPEIQEKIAEDAFLSPDAAKR
ncbi:hypothetical protein WJX84_003512 [Apatococcus fuscideae]|uniref:Uncharacterized protein n=1 Tax=Apatococcus fuscideae TaxID=2026836 RepID=A0AAW1TE43_9CHLO